MNRLEFENIFTAIVENENPVFPYDSPEYLNYTQLNHARYSRWIKKGELNPELVELIQHTDLLNWTIITEPWCGDASHSVPFIILLAETNPKINLNIELRDTAPNRIEKYLTNGSKSIPIFIFSNGTDEKVWGPRPKELSIIFDDLKKKEAGLEDQKIALQKWYNENKGERLQSELINLF